MITTRAKAHCCLSRNAVRVLHLRPSWRDPMNGGKAQAANSLLHAHLHDALECATHAQHRRPRNHAHLSLNLQVVDPLRPLMLRWGFSCGGRGPCSQSAFRVQVWTGVGGELAYDTGVVTSDNQTVAVPAGTLRAATSYFWRTQVTPTAALAAPAAVDIAALPTLRWSPNTTFFTALGDEWTAVPIWAPLNASNKQPTFALLRSTASLEPGERVLSALAFSTANPPVAQMEDGQPQPPKILAAYKLWVGGRLVGVGPGRSRCGPLPCIHNPSWPIEHVYDGFDVTDAASAVAHTGSIDVFVVGTHTRHAHRDCIMLPCVFNQSARAAATQTDFTVVLSPGWLARLCGHTRTTAPALPTSTPRTLAHASIRTHQTRCTGFGVDQSHSAQPSGSTKVQVEVRVVVENGAGETRSIVVKTDGSWNTFDGDLVYRPAGNSGSSVWCVSLIPPLV
jgi:hypothetical protein